MSFFNWELVLDYFPKIFSALPVTLMIVFVASVVGLFLGSIIALVRIERVKLLSPIAAVFVSFIRGTPILVQLYVVYYGVPGLLQMVGIDISHIENIYFIYITYGLNTAAFQSETIRAAILSVAPNQKEACVACGFTKWQAYRKVIIPQAIRIAIPNVGAITVSLLQDTSLAFTLGVIDVVGRARAIGAVSFHTLEGYVDAAIIFIVISFVLERAFALLEKKLAFTSNKESQISIIRKSVIQYLFPKKVPA